MKKWDEMSERERDALVAEKVMGWTGRKIVYEWSDRAKKEYPTIIFSFGGESIGNFATWIDEEGNKIQYGRPHSVYLPKHYSTDISDAWKVVERLRQLGFSPTVNGVEWTTAWILGDVPSNYWHANFVKRDEDGNETSNNSTYAPAAPEAVCLAALRAVGVDV